MKRRLLFASLYMSEGAPIGYIWWYLPTRLRSEGLPIAEITGLTALLVLPWTLKFLWAPLIDVAARKGVPVRLWIAAAQTVMGLTLVPLLFHQGLGSIGFLRLVLLCHAVAAATQDVAIDTLAIRSVSPRELGSINGWMQAGMLLGRSLFGGVALSVSHRIGGNAVVIGLIGLLAFNLLIVWRAREPARTGETSAAPSFRTTLLAAVRRRTTWLGLLFAAASGAVFEGIGAVAGPFLVDQGLSQEAIGAFLAIPAVAAMLIGALLGGVVSDRLGRIRAAGWFLLGLCAAGLSLAAAAGRGSVPELLVGLTILYFGIGCFTAASYALFMRLTDPSLGATQFSAFMAATNGCESWASFATGRLAQGQGYGSAFAAMAAVSLGALTLLRPIGARLRRDREESAPGIEGPAPSDPPESPPRD